MIISSKITDEKWIWVKIPKTGTRAYSQLFYPDKESQLHFHHTFHELYIQNQKKYSGFTVVRHPVTRFISALRHLENINHLGNLPCDNIESLVNFLYDNFDENCLPKNNKTLQSIFGLEYINYHESFFKTQVHWAYHPKVVWFKYENLTTFNDWLKTRLGIDSMGIKWVGEVKSTGLRHLNFNDTKFMKVVQYLFLDDYKVYGYSTDT